MNKPLFQCLRDSGYQNYQAFYKAYTGSGLDIEDFAVAKGIEFAVAVSILHRAEELYDK